MQMTTRSKIITTALLLVALSGIGAADYYLAGHEYTADLAGTPDTVTDTGVAKADGVDVIATMTALGITTRTSEDLTFLAQVSRDAPVSSVVILHEGDRAGSVSWIDGDAKQAFISLKEALLSAFSADVKDLSDRTVQKDGSPTMNILTFRDPALSEETLTFIRIRQRLYEFHTTAGAEAVMQGVIEALTSK